MKSRKILSTAIVTFIASLVAPLVVVSFASAAMVTNGKIAFISDRTASLYEVFSANADGSGVSQLTTDGANVRNPRWSPDGTKILYSSQKTSNWQIYVMNANGTGQTRLTTNSANDYVGNWSPDGTQVVFFSDRTTKNQVYVMNADGTAQTNISNTSNNEADPIWSPVGDKIYYTSDVNTNVELYSMDTDGTSRSRLTTTNAGNFQPTVSQDGTKVYFISDRDGNFEVYRINSDGSSPTNLTNNAAADRRPSLSADGQKIYFQTDRDGNIEVYEMSLAGTSPVRLTINAATDAIPDSQTVLVPTSSTDGSGSKTTTVTQGENFATTNYTVVNKETLTVNGSIGVVTVQTGGTLKGNGTVSFLTVNAGGHYAPGNSPGCMNTSNFTMTSGSSYDVELGGTTACTGYDQTIVTGTVDITGATLNPSLYGSFVPKVGDNFTIIDNDAADAVTGTFAGLAEGATTKIGGVTYKVSYVGGNGNDVVLTVTVVDAAAAATAVTPPKAPNTGFQLLSTNPVATMAVSLLSVAGIYAISRRLKLAQQK